MSLAYSFYESSKIVTQTPSQTIKTRLQELVNKQFSIASSYFTILEEDPRFPLARPTVWIDTETRINHMINVDSGVKLGDDWRELIFKDMEHARPVGKKYFFDNFTWITINSDTYRYPTASTNIRRCNWTLKWYNDKGVLIQEPCIVDYVKMIGSAMGVLDGKQVREGTYDRFIYMQLNEETEKIKRDDRFFVDDIVFRVTKYDRIAHRGLIELSLDEHQVNLEVDDVVNFIADYTIRPPVDNSNVGTTEIFIGPSTISTGANMQWEIYKKVNGVVKTDTYTFSIISGSGASIISSTGNTVVLTAGLTQGLTFTLKAKNVSTSSVITKTIQVTGMW
jgi:hypothetical protein